MQNTMSSLRSAGEGKRRNVEKPGNMHRTRVLLAEDDGDFRDILVWAFEDDGWEVVAVSNGADLLDVLASSLLPGTAVRPFNVLVSDVRMPGWSGLTAIENLSANHSMPPVVVITGFGCDEVHQRAKRAGAIAVLDKPFDLENLRTLVRKVSEASLVEQVTPKSP
jgi:two-component system, response regulator, stage 0 sporulation protein F